MSGTVSGTLSGVDANDVPWTVTFTNASYSALMIQYTVQSFACPTFVASTWIRGRIHGVAGVNGAAVVGTHGTDQITSVTIDFNQIFNDPVNSVLVGLNGGHIDETIVLGPKNVNVGRPVYGSGYAAWYGVGYHHFTLGPSPCNGTAGSGSLTSEYVFHPLP